MFFQYFNLWRGTQRTLGAKIVRQKIACVQRFAAMWQAGFSKYSEKDFKRQKNCRMMRTRDIVPACTQLLLFAGGVFVFFAFAKWPSHKLCLFSISIYGQKRRERSAQRLSGKKTACVQRAVALRSVWGRKFYCSNLVQKFIESTIAQPSTEATLTPSRCCTQTGQEFACVSLCFLYVQNEGRLLSRKFFV